MNNNELRKRDRNAKEQGLKYIKELTDEKRKEEHLALKVKAVRQAKADVKLADRVAEEAEEQAEYADYQAEGGMFGLTHATPHHSKTERADARWWRDHTKKQATAARAFATESVRLALLSREKLSRASNELFCAEVAK